MVIRYSCNCFRIEHSWPLNHGNHLCTNVVLSPYGTPRFLPHAHGSLGQTLLALNGKRVFQTRNDYVRNIGRVEMFENAVEMVPSAKVRAGSLGIR